MMMTKAIFHRKENSLDTRDCAIEKVITFDGPHFDHFSRHLLHDYDFIRENRDLMRMDYDGYMHCLLVVGKGRQDGILIESEGSGYARYSAFLPNAADFLHAQKIGLALKSLTQKFISAAGFVAEQCKSLQTGGEHISLEIPELESRFGLCLQHNDTMMETLIGVLGERPEVGELEIDNSTLIIHAPTQVIEQKADDNPA